MSLCEKLLCPDNVLWFCDVNGKDVVMTFLASFCLLSSLLSVFDIRGLLSAGVRGLRCPGSLTLGPGHTLPVLPSMIPGAAAVEHLRPPPDAAIIGASGTRAACSSV